MGAVTQLFYTNNWLHDAWYDAGFDEAAGNAQDDNFGRGGADGDALRAEAQDDAPSSLNNANMLTPADGDSPRMQMYLWNPRVTALLELGSLGEVAVGFASFGPTQFDVRAPGAVTSDGAAPTTDGCTAPTIDVTGRFVVVDRGNCTFKLKAVNAEAAGAVGLIVVDNVAAQNPPTLGQGEPAGPVNIPAVSVTRAVGDALKAALEAGNVDIHAVRESSALADSDLDVDIVAHEWGHYLHHRLTACTNAICRGESEGWGDFLALHTSVRAGDDLAGTFGMGAYAGMDERDAAYFGIRRYPYTRDLAKNGLTFRHIATSAALPPGRDPNGASNAEVHNTGEVWASMLWHAFTNLLLDATGPSPRYDFDEAKRRMAEYVVLGMTLAPTNPDFTEQRDALLLAAAASDALDAGLLAEGFAARGAGSCAVSPPKSDPDHEGVVESYVVTSRLAIDGWDVEPTAPDCDGDAYLDVGEPGRVDVAIRNDGWATMSGASVTVRDATGRLVFPDGATVAVPDLAAHATTTVSVEVTLADGVAGSSPVEIEIEASDPSGCVTSGVSAGRVHVDSDVAPDTTDAFEARPGTWSATGTSDVWSTLRLPVTGGAWQGATPPFAVDGRLVSPPIAVGVGAPFVLSFTHRHAFEASNGTSWDAGVVEISDDDGASWVDAGAFGAVDYGGVVGGSSVLAGRSAFVGRSAGYPDRSDVAIDFGSALAGRTIRVRFRLATDGSVGDEGWEIDDVGVSGAATPPFVGLVDDAATCGGSSSGGGAVATGSSGDTSGSGGGGASGHGGDGGGGEGNAAATGQGGGSAGGHADAAGAGGDDGDDGDDGDGASTSSGAAGATIAATSGGLDDAGEPVASGDGCDCRAAPGSVGETGRLAVAVATCLAVAARRRRRRDG